MIIDGSIFLLSSSSVVLSLGGTMLGKRRSISVSIWFRRRDYLLIIGATSLLTTLLIFAEFWDIFSIVSLTDVNEQRFVYRARVNVFSYLIHFQMMVFSPLCVYYGIVHRSKILMLIGVAGAVMVYGVAAFKMAPAILVVISLATYLATYFDFIARGLHSRAFFACTLCGLTLSVFLLDRFILPTPLLSYYLIDRSLLAPGIIHLMTLELFSDLPSALWSNSFLRAFFDPVYLRDPFILMGQSFFGTDVRANSGFFSDGYINLGPVGVAIMTALSIIALAITSLLMNNLDKKAIILVFPFILSFVNGPLQVTMITNGLLLFWVLLLLHPKR